MRNTLKTFALGILASSLTLTPYAFAKDKKVDTSSENIDVTQQTVTQEELATVFTLSEVCPAFIKDKKKFDKAYTAELKKLLPNEKNPIEAVNKLSQQANFKKALKEARDVNKKAGEKENKEMCQQVVDFYA